MAQHPMKVVLLDLDGTLTKSDGGIIASVVKTFEELGRPVPDDAELHRFIGPAIICVAIMCLRKIWIGPWISTAATTETVPYSTIRTSPATKFPAAW